jgi:hypothetical protein
MDHTIHAPWLESGAAVRLRPEPSHESIVVLLHELTGKPHVELCDALGGLAPERRARLDAVAFEILRDARGLAAAA